MSTQSLPASSAEAPAVPVRAPQIERTPIPENWQPLFRELTTYYRRLPELLAQGEANRFVVILDEEVCKIWDSYQDANQYGIERFGDKTFMVHQVDPRDVERLARFFPAKEATCQA